MRGSEKTDKIILFKNWTSNMRTLQRQRAAIVQSNRNCDRESKEKWETLLKRNGNITHMTFLLGINQKAWVGLNI